MHWQKNHATLLLTSPPSLHAPGTFSAWNVPGHLLLLLLACHLLMLAPIFCCCWPPNMFIPFNKKSPYKCLHSYNWKEVSINHPYKQFNTSIKSPLQVDIYDLLNNPSAIQSRNSFMFTSSSP